MKLTANGVCDTCNNFHEDLHSLYQKKLQNNTFTRIEGTINKRATAYDFDFVTKAVSIGYGQFKTTQSIRCTTAVVMTFAQLLWRVDSVKTACVEELLLVCGCL